MGPRLIFPTLNTNVLGLKPIVLGPKLIVLWPKSIVLGSKFVLGPRPIVLSQKANEHLKPKTLSQASFATCPKSHEHPKANVFKRILNSHEATNPKTWVQNR